MQVVADGPESHSPGDGGYRQRQHGHQPLIHVGPERGDHEAYGQEQAKQGRGAFGEHSYHDVGF